MGRQYNFSQHGTSADPEPDRRVLAIDTGSPVVSVAVSIGTEVAAKSVTEVRQSSGQVLQMIDAVLRDAALQLSQIDLLLGLRGPGSFTGLRVGLATLQGIRLALGTSTATFPTLRVLASLAPQEATTVTTCVDALRGQWLRQGFSASPPYSPIDEPELATAESLAANSTSHLIGFGISDLRPQLPADSKVLLVEPGPLAPQALRILDSCPPDLDSRLLSNPLYLRAPAVSIGAGSGS
jgi:tRNA threonylcarbamoyl adenosine modification protein YeaZ